MKLGAFTLSYWNDEIGAERKRPELQRWFRHIKAISNPDEFWIASGTKSSQALSPLPVPIVCAEVPYTRIDDCESWSYAMAAEEAALWHMILNTDCDAVIHLCSDGILRNTVFGEIEKLMASKNLLFAFNWLEMVDDAFYVMKREGVVHYLNSRQRPNLPGKKSMISEREKANIFAGKWHNPKPAKNHYRFDGIHPSPSYDEVLANWPICIRPPDDLVDRYAHSLL